MLSTVQASTYILVALLAVVPQRENEMDEPALEPDTPLSIILSEGYCAPPQHATPCIIDPRATYCTRYQLNLVETLFTQQDCIASLP